MTSEQLLNEIVKAQADYAKIFRKTISLTRRRLAIQNHNFSPDDFDNEVIRESDLEHIGHLPLVATMIHPHLENRDKVDLGKTLLYLALHEAPERIVGDVMHEDKTDDYNNAELEAAHKIYSDSYEHYFKLYEDFHFIKNIDAQFAYSVDRIAPMIYYEAQDVDTRSIIWDAYDLNTDKIRKSVRRYMEWDKTLYDLCEHILDTIDQQNKDNKIII